MPPILKPLPPELTRAINNLGDRILVVVEGPNDLDVFRALFADRRTRLEHCEAGGKGGVKSLLIQLQQQRPDVNVFGVCDRDFADTAEVTKRLTTPNEKSFLLTWFCIENYLFNPTAVYEVLNGWFYPNPPSEIASVSAVDSFLLDACHQLRSVMAANWILLLHDKSKIRREDENWARSRVVDMLASRLECNVSEADTLLVAREAEIDNLLTDINEAYTVISGKYLKTFISNFVQSKGRGLHRHSFFGLMLLWQKNKPHPHLTEIIDGKILASKQSPV